jgi:hypothetical protein
MNTLLRRLDKYLDADIEALTVKDDISKLVYLLANNYSTPSGITLHCAECNTLPQHIPYTPENSTLVVGVTVTCNGDPRFIMVFYLVLGRLWIQLYDKSFPSHTKVQNTQGRHATEIADNIQDRFREIDGWVNYMPRFVRWWKTYKNTARSALREDTEIGPHKGLGTFELQRYVFNNTHQPELGDWTLLLSFHPDGFLHVSITSDDPADYRGPYIIPDNETQAAEVIRKI